MSKFTANWQVETGYVPYYRVYGGVTTKAGYIDSYDTALLIAAAPDLYRLAESLANMPDEQCMISPLIHEARRLIARIDGKEK